jgi:hypothetical protein
VESVVLAMLERQRKGDIRSRLQSRVHSDAEISRDGLFAELAACMILCPAAESAWRRLAEQGAANRGNDLQRAWTGLPLPVEV